MRIANLTLLGAIMAASAAGAQAVHKEIPIARAGAVAAVAPPPTVIVVVPATEFVVAAGTAFAPGTAFSSGTVFFRNLPVTVLADGRVFADFGRGLEYVVRNCAALNTTVTVQPNVGQPVVVQPLPGLPTALPVPVTQLVPNPISTQFANQNLNNSQACWTSTVNGQVVVGRQ